MTSQEDADLFVNVVWLLVGGGAFCLALGAVAIMLEFGDRLRSLWQEGSDPVDGRSIYRHVQELRHEHEHVVGGKPRF